MIEKDNGDIGLDNANKPLHAVFIDIYNLP